MIQFDRLLTRLHRVKPSLAEALRSTIEGLRTAPHSDIGALLAPLLPPKELIEPNLGEIPTSEGRTLPIFVMGAGRGGVARSLTKLIVERDLDTRCVIVETDPGRMLATLLSDDWSEALTEDRVRFAVGPDILRSVQNALPEELDPLLEPVLTPSIRLVRSNSLQPAAIIDAGFRRAVLAHAQLFRKRCHELGHRRDQERTPLAKKSWRIFSLVGGKTTALKHLAPSILRAAKQAGHEDIVDVTNSSDPFISSQLSRRAFDVDPDLALSFLKPGRTLVPWRKSIPSIVLVSSNPNLLPIETFDWSERDLIVLADPSFVPIYRRLGLDPVVRPLAADIPDPSRLQRIEAPPCDVLAVGSLPDASFVMPGLTAPLHDLIRRLAEIWIANPDRTAREILNSTRLPAPAAAHPRIELGLAYEATRLRRIRSVMVLIEAGFKVRVHGDDDWQNVLRGTSGEGCWHGWLRAGDEQSAAFRHAPVTINVNHFAAPDMLNMRSFEVPAAGGVLVTDDRSVLRSSFEVGREVLAFGRVEELPDLVGDVLRDGDVRQDIADAGRRRAVRDHSWTAWWTWAEQELRKRFG